MDIPRTAAREAQWGAFQLGARLGSAGRSELDAVASGGQAGAAVGAAGIGEGDVRDKPACAAAQAHRSACSA